MEAVDLAFTIAKVLDRKDLLIYKNKHNQPIWNATPCIITFTNAFISTNNNLNIHKIFKESWANILLLDPSLSTINTPKILFKKCSALNNILVYTIFPPRQWASSGRIGSGKDVINKTVMIKKGIFNHPLFHVSRPCGRTRCLSCQNINETHSFIGTTHNTTHKLRQSFYCDSLDLIYLITCSRCRIQYIGETGTTLRKHFNAHRSCVFLNKETPIGVHFNSIQHNIRDLKVTPIESFSNNDKSKRLTR